MYNLVPYSVLLSITTDIAVLLRLRLCCRDTASVLSWFLCTAHREEYELNVSSCGPQVAHDVDGSGNYLLLTHRHVAHLHPLSSYHCRRPQPSPPGWVLYHDFTICHDNCICIVSEIHPQM